MKSPHFFLLSVALGLVLFLSSCQSQVDTFQNSTDEITLDSEIEARLINITVDEPKSSLLRGSQLDYSGYILQYEFEVNEFKYTKSELVKSSDISFHPHIEGNKPNSLSTVWIKYSSQNPRVSTIDISKVTSSDFTSL